MCWLLRRVGGVLAVAALFLVLAAPALARDCVDMIDDPCTGACQVADCTGLTGKVYCDLDTCEPSPTFAWRLLDPGKTLEVENSECMSMHTPHCIVNDPVFIPPAAGHTATTLTVVKTQYKYFSSSSTCPEYALLDSTLPTNPCTTAVHLDWTGWDDELAAVQVENNAGAMMTPWSSGNDCLTDGGYAAAVSAKFTITYGSQNGYFWNTTLWNGANADTACQRACTDSCFDGATPKASGDSYCEFGSLVTCGDINGDSCVEEQVTACSSGLSCVESSATSASCAPPVCDASTTSATAVWNDGGVNKYCTRACGGGSYAWLSAAEINGRCDALPDPACACLYNVYSGTALTCYQAPRDLPTGTGWVDESSKEVCTDATIRNIGTCPAGTLLCDEDALADCASQPCSSSNSCASCTDTSGTYECRRDVVGGAYAWRAECGYQCDAGSGLCCGERNQRCCSSSTCESGQWCDNLPLQNAVTDSGTIPAHGNTNPGWCCTAGSQYARSVSGSWVCDNWAECSPEQTPPANVAPNAIECSSSPYSQVCCPGLFQVGYGAFNERAMCVNRNTAGYYVVY